MVSDKTGPMPATASLPEKETNAITRTVFLNKKVLPLTFEEIQKIDGVVIIVINQTFIT
ncbi:MAG: hypothetical protein Q8J68_00500 [Methanolobus sp.]|uniref:hypothetical protein n=1 Tax=Methanolobus sp. TaxID=1874737 RepID=UPI0027316F67|nr:hypothetical protein [Methanolobus sp.]MDP2215762.1 hypothetical protein [Methanolobus sp.]